MSQSEQIKILWGRATWELFHTIAAKINEDFFNKKRVNLFILLIDICKNLPCPTCAQHASMIMTPNNLRYVTTKEQLITFLYNFHNQVNIQTNKPLFKYENLYIYKQINLGIALHNFLNFYPKRYNNSFQLNVKTNQHQRVRVANNLKQWLNQNRRAFI
jgi:hypothetical protein